VSAVNAEVEKELDSGVSRDQLADSLPKNLPVAAWRAQFAGEDRDSLDFFDQSFAALLKGASAQGGMR